MTRFDSSNARCLVFTYKEGLLSPLAHDLKIEVTRFRIEANDAREVVATFDAGSLRVLSAMKHGTESGSLSDKDKREVENNIRSEVLASGSHPEIRFRSTEVTEEGGGYRVRGDLEVHGETRPIELHAKQEGEKLIAELTLHQPDFGIEPYRAAMGTLKVKADVRIRLELPKI